MRPKANKPFQGGWLWLQRSQLNLGLALLCGLLFGLEQAGLLPQLQWLALQPELIRTDNAWWQLITGNFVHFTPHHLFWNLGALLILTLLFETEQRWKEDALFLMSGALFIGSLLYLTVSELSQYRGLSGLLYGYTVFYALKIYGKEKKLCLALMLFITARLLWQHSPWFDQSASIDTLGGKVSTEAHLFGYLFGCLGYSGLRFFSLIKSKRDTSTSVGA